MNARQFLRSHPAGLIPGLLLTLLLATPAHAQALIDTPPCQTTCRPDRTKDPGAAKDRDGSIRTEFQGQSGGAVAAAA